MSNQTSTPIFIREISFAIWCNEKDANVPFAIQARHLPKKRLSSHEAQVVFFEHFSKQPVIISENNLFEINPNTVMNLEAIVFIPIHTELNMAEAPSYAHRLDLNLYHVDSSESLQKPITPPLLDLWQGTAREKFAEIENLYNDVLHHGLEQTTELSGKLFY